jgi:DNA-binding response OmpR family regulator
MLEASLVVFERAPRWVPELKRRFADSSVIVRGCSTPRDVLAAVEEGTAGVVLVLDGREAECLALVGEVSKRAIRPVVIVIANDAGEDLEWPLRELGAASVVSDRITSDELVARCQRLLGPN